jgi:hypothetical protein
VRRADNLTTFMWVPIVLKSGAPNSWKSQDLSKSVQELLYHSQYKQHGAVHVCMKTNRKGIGTSLQECANHMGLNVGLLGAHEPITKIIFVKLTEHHPILGRIRAYSQGINFARIHFSFSKPGVKLRVADTKCGYSHKI